MEYKNLGRSGLIVSALGLGCNNLGRQVDEAGTKAIVDKCVEMGITYFDGADVYGAPPGHSEEVLGKALKPHRRNVVLATKGTGRMGEGPGWSGASRRYLMDALDASLRRLDTDYIDLYQLHFPDANTPIEETLRALDDMVRSGKVRYVGCCNFSAWQVVEAAWIVEDRAPGTPGQRPEPLQHARTRHREGPGPGGAEVRPRHPALLSRSPPVCSRASTPATTRPQARG